MALNHLKLFKNDRICLLSWKKSFWASQTHFWKFSDFHPCLSPNPWFGIWGSLVGNMVTCQNGFKSLETLQKWSRMPSFMKKSFWASQTHFWKFSEFHPCLSPNPWFGIWGSLVWNIVTCQNGLKSLETFQKWSHMPSFMKKIILSQSNSFLEVFRISPLSKSQSMIWYLGKSGVKYGNLSKWLEITWNFAKMIAYAFFHEKIILSQSNSFLEVFRISPLSKFQSMIWYLGKSGVKYGNLSKWLEINWNFGKMIAYAFFQQFYVSILEWNTTTLDLVQDGIWIRLETSIVIYIVFNGCCYSSSFSYKVTVMELVKGTVTYLPCDQ